VRADLEAIVGSTALDERAVRETDIRGNLSVPSHRGRYAAAALFPAVWIIREFLPARLRFIGDQVAAGVNPAAIATLAWNT